jgi:DNA-binding MarR family transcriptional regulator
MDGFTRPADEGAGGERIGGHLLPAQSETLALLARQLHEFRRRRSSYIPADLLGEPGWDLLLDLYASEYEGRLISVTSGSIASGAPTTTGLRWIRALETGGLIRRQPSRDDRRRYDLVMTHAGRKAVEGALKTLCVLVAV